MGRPIRDMHLAAPVVICLVVAIGLGGVADSPAAGARAVDSGLAAGGVVAPRAVSLTFGQSQQFTAPGAGDGSDVSWSVDGVSGGSAAVGTVSASGLYVSPRKVGTHTIAVKSATGPVAGARVFVTTSPGVLTFHNDLARTGQNVRETVLSPATVKKASFGKLRSYPTDGITFASPLYVQNLEMGGSLGTHNVVFVATEHDIMYAFDADGRGEGPLWKRSFIDPAKGVTPVPAGDASLSKDIPNEIGITSTPVIDPATNTIYVVAKTKEIVGGRKTYVQRLHALDVRTGADRAGAASVVIRATVRGTGRGSVNGRLSFNALRENQRAALTLANGVIYLAFGSHGDAPPFHGWLLGYKASNLRQVMVFNVTPDDDGGGIWMSGNGIAVDNAGRLYLITSNGLYSIPKRGPNYRDAFLKMNASGRVLDYFAPKNQSDLDVPDLDLGSAGVVLLPNQPGPHPHLLTSAGKDGTIFLIDRDKMGRFDPRANHVVQELPNALRTVSGYSGGNFSAPVYFNKRVYFSPVAAPIRGFALTRGRLKPKPVTNTTATFAAHGATLSVSAASATDPNAIMWALQYKGAAKTSVLHAYRANDLRIELWNSTQAGSRDHVGAWTKFSLPTIANGKVYTTGIDRLNIYGLLPNATLPS